MPFVGPTAGNSRKLKLNEDVNPASSSDGPYLAEDGATSVAKGFGELMEVSSPKVDLCDLADWPICWCCPTATSFEDSKLQSVRLTAAVWEKSALLADGGACLGAWSSHMPIQPTADPVNYTHVMLEMTLTTSISEKRPSEPSALTAS